MLTIFYKALTIIYKIVAVFLAFLSLGIFYDNNYNFVSLIDFLNTIFNIIIGIYIILIKTLKSIFKLIFKNIYENTEENEIEHEPYEYYTNKNNYNYNLGQESEYSWYQDFYVQGGCILLLLLLLGYGYKKWDSDSDIKENIVEIGSSLILLISSIKELLLNKIRNPRNNNETSDTNTENETSDSDNSIESIKLDILPENVDVRIISEPYKYLLFKNIHDLSSWPELYSSEYNSMITRLNNSKPRKLIHTYETMENLIDNYLKSEEILKSTTPEELNQIENIETIMSLHKHFTITNEQIKPFINNENWTRQTSFELSHKIDSPQSTTSSLEYGTPKVSYSQLSDETPKASTSRLPDIKPKTKLEEINENYKKQMEKFIQNKEEHFPIKYELNNESLNQSETTFSTNLKGKFKTKDSIFEEGKTIFNRMRENLNEQSAKFQDSLSQSKVLNIINTTTELINEESSLENITQINPDNNILPDVKTYHLNPDSTEKAYHIHPNKPNELCNKDHAN